MGPISFVKEYWRILLLVGFVSGALLALFIPGGIMADDSLVEDESVDDNPTNLEYGLGLDGGTRISAPVIGMTAEDIDAGAVDDEDGTVDRERLTEIENTLYDELDLDTGNASVSVDDDGNVHAEVFTHEVTEEEFAAALAEADVEVDPDDIRDGVSAQTRDQIVETIQSQINAAGLSGGDAYESARLGGDYYIVTEVPDMDPDELRELLSERGVVEVRAYHPDGNGSHTNETVLEGEDIVQVDPPEPAERGTGYSVPVQVDSNAAPHFQERMNELGFTSEGIGQCSLRGDGETINFDHADTDEQYCLLTVVDGEVVDAHSMGDLADGMSAGTWANDPSFVMGAQSQQQAQTLSVNLQAGALPAPLDFGQEQTLSLSPALADQFKLYSLIIGTLSVLTVSGMVFLRYRDVRVAAPMVVTAMAEVLILLGFAALIRMPLDLSHVAGFIAVVGTGVDDLIIIADEVMDDGEVNSQKVFESRFRKAFWIIGAAAATTIIAMSPLAVLSLGDLRGFAIITILGVLIGVLITRPAYGDILQRLLTDK
ncbi:preprotein translocase subunit SecD [Natronorubrum sp. JWXQ-INN-674]|uniref:Protein-export membrane protein SecD n=1 Tax=Natronorubrum halalkaliphilum TaxID=2691917 RepID=A0A6B0VQA4_9EURY|nr:preprotein translocase subunit SecD [Natronorubrum halalkaliphilum]MXV63485.1 preprotein translocase subunit SecD [Natronorubrum halalkaliphilum]